MTKERWFNGPYLPEVISVTYTMTFTMYCATGLNKTSAIFVGVSESMKGVVVYDFKTNNWIQQADTPNNILWCSCSSAHDKNYNQ